MPGTELVRGPPGLRRAAADDRGTGRGEQCGDSRADDRPGRSRGDDKPSHRIRLAEQGSGQRRAGRQRHSARGEGRAPRPPVGVNGLFDGGHGPAEQGDRVPAARITGQRVEGHACEQAGRERPVTGRRLVPAR
jgi:hypothetical protein